MPTFTIIIPHYNIPHLLQRCLNSIPDIEDIQVIVVDNNSDPAKVEFSNFPGQDRKYTQIIYDKIGNGAGHARNVALPEIKGKWVLFSDSDDFFTQDFYQLINGLENEDSDLILFKVESVNSDTLKRDANRDTDLNKYIDLCVAGKIRPFDVAMKNAAPWAKMIKADLIRDNKIDFEEVRYSNDALFSAKVACYATKISVNHHILYTITTREGSLAYSSKKDENNFLIRFGVQIRRNRFLKSMHRETKFLLPLYFEAKRISKETSQTVLKQLISNRMLLTGLIGFLSYEFKSKILKKYSL